jgi:iron(III) transport system permease protein
MMLAAASGRRPPLFLLAVAVLVGASMCVPVLYLVLRALEADPETLFQIVFRERNARLLGNTLTLTFCVLVATTMIALPLAWLVVRSDLRFKRFLAFLGVLPLAVPGYVMAYALIGLSGYSGFANAMFGITLPRPNGLWGATLALSLYTFPYLFLNLRSALMGLDPSLEASAYSLGRSRLNTFFTVLLPHLWPAFAAGWLVVGLYVLGDFGVIALMRYEVFSYAIFTQYAAAVDRIYAAWLALMLMGVTVGFILMESWFSRRSRYSRVAIGVARQQAPVTLGPWRPVAWLFLATVYGASLGLPALVLTYWLNLAPAALDVEALWQVFVRTTLAAAPAALLATALALPVVYLTVRYPSPLSWAMNRLVYLGYAVPPLAFALAMVFLALTAIPWAYQTLGLLIAAYSLSFLALAVGPIRSALLQLGARTEEAALSLGYSRAETFLLVTLPTLRRAITAGALLVFIIVVKELPITFLLAPTGYTTLATRVFGYTSEGMLYEAALYAALIVLFSSLFVGLILRYEGRR